MYLKNRLKTQLGKYVKEKDPKPVNHFIEFFKKAYPENTRRKDFTWVLMDIKKNDIVGIIKKLISKNNIKYINDLRTLKQLTDILNISIVQTGKSFKVEHK